MINQYEKELEQWKESIRSDPGKWLGEIGVPPKYQVKKPSDRRPNDSGLFIFGPAGSGKTTEAAAVLAGMLPSVIESQNGYAVNYRFSAAWISVPKLVVDLRHSIGRKTGQAEADIIDDFIKKKILVLDDLGSEKQSDYSSQVIYLIVSERINWLRPTIVTSNMTPEEMNKIDARLVSRLLGMRRVEYGGIDLRVKESNDG